LQRKSSPSCTQGTPAALPFGIPGIGDEIEGAIQHAAHPDRHGMEEDGIVIQTTL
jgi:hypothetical protein